VACISTARKLWKDPSPFDTVYFGGGTPSLLPPEDVTPGARAAWRSLGLRTVSLGVQSFSDEALRFLGRRHSAAQARAAVEVARAAVFDTVSVDLIFGLPGQTPEAWRREMGVAVALGPAHLSCYQLTIHARTRLGVAATRGQLSEMPEGEQAILFELTPRAEGNTCRSSFYRTKL
jgi:oxygen-independent coproporphyrinogen III oxidase